MVTKGDVARGVAYTLGAIPGAIGGAISSLYGCVKLLELNGAKPPFTARLDNPASTPYGPLIILSLVFGAGIGVVADTLLLNKLEDALQKYNTSKVVDV